MHLPERSNSAQQIRPVAGRNSEPQLKFEGEGLFTLLVQMEHVLGANRRDSPGRAPSSPPAWWRSHPGDTAPPVLSCSFTGRPTPGDGPNLAVRTVLFLALLDDQDHRRIRLGRAADVRCRLAGRPFGDQARVALAERRGGWRGTRRGDRSDQPLDGPGAWLRHWPYAGGVRARGERRAVRGPAPRLRRLRLRLLGVVTAARRTTRIRHAPSWVQARARPRAPTSSR